MGVKTLRLAAILIPTLALPHQGGGNQPAVTNVSGHNEQKIGGVMNKRRRLLVALGASALTVPFCAVAQQQGKVRRIGFCWKTRNPITSSDSMHSKQECAIWVTPKARTT